MDISNNIDLITLECLTNPGFYDKYNLKKNNPSKISKEDRKFYKKRIINETKKMLRNDFNTPTLKKIFNEYVISLVDYFKIVDKRDILQEDYKDIAESITLNLDLNTELDDNNVKTKEDADLLLFRSIKITNPSLDNFVKKKYTKAPEQMVMPQQKDINLRDPNLKVKGIKDKDKEKDKEKDKDNLNIEKKKNITNMYDKTENTEKNDNNDDKK